MNAWLGISPTRHRGRGDAVGLAVAVSRGRIVRGDAVGLAAAVSRGRIVSYAGEPAPLAAHQPRRK